MDVESIVMVKMLRVMELWQDGSWGTVLSIAPPL
jgi:hypothetical protein